MAVPFDTHATITRLTAAGMDRALAEAFTETLRTMYSEHAVTRSECDRAMERSDASFERLMTELAWIKWIAGPGLLATLVLVINLVLRK